MDSSVYERENEIISSSLQPPSLLETIAQSDGSIANNIGKERQLLKEYLALLTELCKYPQKPYPLQNITVICDKYIFRK